MVIHSSQQQGRGIFNLSQKIIYLTFTYTHKYILLPTKYNYANTNLFHYNSQRNPVSFCQFIFTDITTMLSINCDHLFHNLFKTPFFFRKILNYEVLFLEIDLRRMITKYVGGQNEEKKRFILFIPPYFICPFVCWPSFFSSSDLEYSGSFRVWTTRFLPE